MSISGYESGRPVYEQVAERLKHMIARRFKPGDILPDYNQLAGQFAVGRVTIKKAMDLLAVNGLVTPIRKKGTIVQRQLSRGERRLEQLGLVAACPLATLFSSPSLAEITSAIFDRFDQLGADARLFSLAGRHGRLLPMEVGRAGLEGAMLLGIEDEAFLAEISTLEIPKVAVDTVSPHRLDCVACDNVGAAGAIVAHLVSLGHRRIIYAAPAPQAAPAEGGAPVATDHNCGERRQGFLSAMEQAGLPSHTAIFRPMESLPMQSALAALAELVQAPRGPTAVVADDEALGRQIVAALRQREIRVPEQVSVAALAGAGGLETIQAGLTFCRFNYTHMGRQAVDLLELRCRTSPPLDRQIIRVAYQLIEGKTVAQRAE